MDKMKKLETTKKTPPSTPKPQTTTSPSITRIQIFQSFDKKQNQDYSGEIEK